MSNDTKQKLLSSRKDLLDIGLRNSLINFRSGAKSLRIVDELSAEVLNILYRQNRSMTFLPLSDTKLEQIAAVKGEEALPDDSRDALLHELDGYDWGGEALNPGEVSKKHTDTKLQTALNGESLFLSLLRIHSEAEIYVQEQGVNILFLALGFLHWYEADAADKVRKAPLLLVPVSLKRLGAKDSFKLEYTEDDLVQNLSLAAKLKIDFKIDLPTYGTDVMAEAEEMPPVADFYSQVDQAIANQSRWKVVPDEIHLGFFSFGKFLMFNDLDPSVWPEDKQPSDHTVMCKLLGDGFHDETPAFAEGTHIDAVIDPGQVKFVRDADSSQTMAILEARSGRNLIIQGPPGTGKSQTITNIIADLVGQRKTVLFVSEKMAALEVVKNRLDECHLGDAVLELHSHKATKNSVLKELARTLVQGRPVIKDQSDDLGALKAIRDSLNEYCDAVNLPIGISEVPFVNALGAHLKLKREHPGLPLWPFAPMKNWTQGDQFRLRDKVCELAMHLGEMGKPSESPFWGCKKTSFSPIEQERLKALLEEAARITGLILASSEKLAVHFGLSQPASLSDVDVVCRAAQRAADAPKLSGIQLSRDDWQSRRDSLRQLLKAGEVMSALKAKHESMLIEQAWSQDLLQVRQHYSNYGDKWWRIFSGNFRRAKATLQGLCKSTLPPSQHGCLAIIDDVLVFQEKKKVYQDHAQLGEALFGAQWVAERSDWEVLQRLSNWIFDLYDDLGKGDLPLGIVAFLSGQRDASGLGGDTERIRSAVQDIQATLAQLMTRLEYDQAASTVDLNIITLEELQARLSIWLEKLPQLYLLSRFNQLKEEMLQLGLKEVVTYASDWEHPANSLIAAFDLCWFSGLVELGYANSPAIAKFDNIKQSHLIERFRSLDKASLAHAQAELAKAIWEHQPRQNQPGEMAIINTELNKKRRHKPIRQLIAEAGRAIQQIKPVFMMSPMSIANFLPPGKLEFDVVIFDEASQVKAVDGFGAILRGKQTIVVGDTRQMPPSDFFGRDVDLNDEDNVTADIESILSLFRARGVPERYLSWHYRSRHESLIAVSNVEFYERRLVIFPASGTNPHAKGLSFQHLPDALYDRGRTRTNKGEACAVAQAVLHHARATPNLSLGVVAFSVAQRDLIQVELEILRRSHPDLDAFFSSAHPSEPFFVKNLENVQGDERDVIFISIGYGRNESGRIAKEFGPINRSGGERRLNVLISRAKMAMVVFCNFTAGDLELDENAHHGVRALKHFLHYAETGKLDIPAETGKQADSPFELEVKHVLEERGYSLEPQVGTAGYFIDLAVKDPEQRGRYILAIECDGASYHSARSARDRDRLRQGVLESLGWRFHRIWSTDWFRNPQSELEKAVAAIEQAKVSVVPSRPPNVSTEPTVVIQRDEASLASEPLSAPLYEKANLPPWTAQELHEISLRKLASMIGLIVDVEAPVHESNITKRLLPAFNISRAGKRIVEHVMDAIRLGHTQNLFHYDGGFVYKDNASKVRPRNRSNLEPAEKKIEFVAPQEIDVAIIDTVKISFSISRDEAVGNVASFLGFGRATSNIAGAISTRIDSLIAQRQIKDEGGRLVLTDAQQHVGLFPSHAKKDESNIKTYKLLAPDGKTYESQTPGLLGGYKKDRIYGRLDCRSALHYLSKGQYAAHRVFFADENAAIAAGYRPCAKCMPERYAVWKAGGECGSADFPWHTKKSP